MAIFFSGEEILKVAVAIEENGIVFYEQLMLGTRRAELKTTFEYLAGQEKVHKRVFSEMMQKAGKSYTVESYPGEEAAYLKSLADSVLFSPDKLKELARKSTDQEALDYSLGFEKDAVLFYQGMVGIVREQDRKTVDWVIGQEKNHITRILELKALLASPGIQEYGH
ncbi:MAG: ferritin family protein [Chloroflexi bacterium]|nr:ferritin family protein [Chloroflexota bacterium]